MEPVLTALALYLGLILDAVLGEPRRFHPLVAFGRLANRLEAVFNRSFSAPVDFLLGALAWMAAVIPLVAVVTRVSSGFPGIQVFVDVLACYFCVARRSLGEHIMAVYRPLDAGNLAGARRAVGYIVSRDVGSLAANGIRKAAIESALENGSDAVFAPVFWFLLLGAPGIVLYRLANTLDAMWGYRNARFIYFGKWAARVDDILNWVPARLVALSYLLLGNSKNAWYAWKTQAKECASPNAGPVMAAGAGALCVEVGGNAEYHGKVEYRPLLGRGKAPQNHDLVRALRLIDKTLVIWCIVVFIMMLGNNFY